MNAAVLALPRAVVGALRTNYREMNPDSRCIYICDMHTYDLLVNAYFKTSGIVRNIGNRDSKYTVRMNGPFLLSEKKNLICLKN